MNNQMVSCTPYEQEVFLIMTRIGVEPSLSDVEELLKQKGYDVVRIQNEQQMDQCDCYVVTGLDSNVLGISDTTTKASVITASGMTADEICQEVEQRVQIKLTKKNQDIMILVLFALWLDRVLLSFFCVEFVRHATAPSFQFLQ